MHISRPRIAGLTLMLLAATGLAACGNVSHKVFADGSGAEQLVWPAPDSVTPMHKGGSFPSVSDLRLIKSGMSKPQIMQLLGSPHFSEGAWGVREWNYLFNFRVEGTVTQCQYKILFDERKLARSFNWQPASCAALLDEQKPAPAVTPVSMVVVEKEQVFTLGSDALFGFDKSDVSGIKSGGRMQLAELAKKIEGMPDNTREIHVVGYTDRLGSDDYNQALSQRRADTVMRILQDDGVASERMHAEGRGKANPVKECDERQRPELIACLAPNRRVEVKVKGSSH